MKNLTLTHLNRAVRRSAAVGAALGTTAVMTALVIGGTILTDIAKSPVDVQMAKPLHCPKRHPGHHRKHRNR